MSSEQYCRSCGQPQPKKYEIWQILEQHLEGSTVSFLSQETGYCEAVVQIELDNLHDEGNAYQEKGKWYPEMAVSMGHHFH